MCPKSDLSANFTVHGSPHDYFAAHSRNLGVVGGDGVLMSFLRLFSLFNVSFILSVLPLPLAFLHFIRYKTDSRNKQTQTYRQKDRQTDIHRDRQTFKDQYTQQDCLLSEGGTIRECVHLVTCVHFWPRDKDGGHSIRSAIVENPMLHASITALYLIERELLPIGNRNFRSFRLL